MPNPRSKSGVEITDEIAEQLVDEAERGYDLSKGKRVGRKSLTGGDGKSPRINFRLTPESYERLAERGRREGKRVGELVREAVEQFLGKNTTTRR